MFMENEAARKKVFPLLEAQFEDYCNNSHVKLEKTQLFKDAIKDLDMILKSSATFSKKYPHF